MVRVFFFVSFLWFTVPWLWTLCTLDAADCYHLTPDAVSADLRSMRSRLAAGDDQAMHRLFPEGRLFSHSFYGFTLVNVAVSNPQDRAFRQHTLAELTRLITITEYLSAQPPFDQCETMIPKGGVIAAGHVNLLRAGYAILGGSDQAILAAYHTQSELLYQSFGKSAVATLESYPGLTWPVDNVVALESLRLHDVLYKTSYTAAVDRWVQWMTAHADHSTGLFNMQIDQQGGIHDGPRGCGLSWTFAFLPAFAPDVARQQYALYRDNWFLHPLGTTGIREFPPDRQEQFVDADTGPIVFGMGTAATGFGIAAAKANNDPANLTGLLRGLNICSFPAYSTDLSHSRFFGQVLLADELALWGQTITRWDAPALLPAAPARAQPLWHFWVVLLLLIAFTALFMWLLLRTALGAWRSCRESPKRWTLIHQFFLILAILTLALFVLVPEVRWLYAFLVLAFLEVMEARFFPLRRPDPAPSPPIS